jgi:hypothetical protein
MPEPGNLRNSVRQLMLYAAPLYVASEQYDFLNSPS